MESKLNNKLFEKICKKLETADCGILKLCKEFLVSTETFYETINNDEIASKRYASAKQRQIENYSDKIHEIEDEMLNAVQNCDPKCSNAVAQTYKLKIDNLKWLLSKLVPKKYGDRIDMNHSGSVDLSSAITEARNRANG